MIISRPRPKRGTRFAWLPVVTPEGKVWLEDVHYEWQEHGFGGYTYARVHYKTDSFGLPKIDYTTPPSPMDCRHYNPNGPTPCRHPHCDCPMPSPYLRPTHPAYRYPQKAFWDWWNALPNERREEIKRFMGADPL